MVASFHHMETLYSTWHILFCQTLSESRRFDAASENLLSVFEKDTGPLCPHVRDVKTK